MHWTPSWPLPAINFSTGRRLMNSDDVAFLCVSLPTSDMVVFPRMLETSYEIGDSRCLTYITVDTMIFKSVREAVDGASGSSS